MYSKQFEIRWSDLDANRHLANSAYINFMSHTRMGFLMENGFGQKQLAQHNIGPVVFTEHVYYYKEIFAGKPVTVSLELDAISNNGMYFEFLHNMYDSKGNHCASCEMMGAWINLETRKLTALPQELMEGMLQMTKTKNFKTITKEDTRRFGKLPQNISPEELMGL
ncbi:thioesterase family protein [Gramella sp. AN32]|uniref:Acyl-CoA thioesterase n=1 Tax=Christiangramia antarctica TaxID=2058158 RepID=A0ABW5X0X3_9FLAO|nr:thioesterase family protein [Gramella sp. AN32]MCM4154872.1 thioesterase [Gramella sp. AN32]